MQICLVGAGHAHILILKKLTEVTTPGIQWVFISPYEDFSYSGLFTSALSGETTLASAQVSLASLVQRAQARGNNISLRLDEAYDLNLRDRAIHFRQAGEILFELASFNVAGESPLPGLTPVKPVSLLSSVLESENFRRIQIVGGGVAGVEIALCLAARYRKEKKTTQLQIVEKSQHLLGTAPLSSQRRAQELLKNAGVEVCFGKEATESDADLRLSAVPQQAQRWLRESGLKLSSKGKWIQVNSLLETSALGIFAVGEGTFHPEFHWPQNGIVPVRQSQILFHNLLVKAGLKNQALTFVPQETYLTLLNTGDGKALGFKGSWSLGHQSGNLWLKNRIDQHFMAGLRAKRD